ncbi:MAG: hypothetical protein IK065_05330 [Neisseriaceae bacterium]|nr:hypothetical protein [Neisseriaceae bacterium]
MCQICAQASSSNSFGGIFTTITSNRLATQNVYANGQEQDEHSVAPFQRFPNRPFSFASLAETST